MRSLSTTYIVVFNMVHSYKLNIKLIIGISTLLLISIVSYLYQRPTLLSSKEIDSIQMEEVRFKNMKLKLPSESEIINDDYRFGLIYTFGIGKDQLLHSQSPIDFSVTIAQRDYDDITDAEFQEMTMAYINDDRVYHQSVCGTDNVRELMEISTASLEGWQFEADCLGKVYTYYINGPAQQLYTIAMKIEPKAQKKMLYRDIIDESIKSIQFE